MTLGDTTSLALRTSFRMMKRAASAARPACCLLLLTAPNGATLSFNSCFLRTHVLIRDEQTTQPSALIRRLESEMTQLQQYHHFGKTTLQQTFVFLSESGWNFGRPVQQVGPLNCWR